MITTWGILDSAWMTSNVFIGTKVVLSKRDLCWFSISGHTRTSKSMLMEPISAVCDAIYKGMFALLLIIIPNL
jgi:hypothetical protein